MPTPTSDIRGPFRAALPAVLFVSAIFFLNFLSRVMLAPVMPLVQADLGFAHTGAGVVFMVHGAGNALGLLLCGFLSRAATHRRTVGISSLLVGAAALTVPLAGTYAWLLTAVFVLGVCVGLYLPSGIATIFSLIRKEDWGKAMAVHELAPNLAYVAAPLLAEAVLLHYDWRAPFVLLGAVQIVLGLWFIRSGRGGNFPGVVPGPRLMLSILRRSDFWLLVLFFSLGVGASVGPYAMLPLYLADVHGFERETANRLLAVSRVLACATPFVAGWITDRWGPRPAILLCLLLSGGGLLALGLCSGPALVAAVLFQPTASVLMFAPGFTMLSTIFPPEQRSVAVALMGPPNALIGLGVVPTFLGAMGDAGYFHYGFAVQGCLLLASIALLRRLPAGTGGRVD
ncbi:MFS transporter [Pseudodesulfovibrio pelocollis]|uniref:MFS transporter n=1 Tax=Pseudodesulfovibrio pelocollis TaxID=3051432 RepID=UPI00255AF901|nr:MFS transporter [Pseudodesulfovibrio sp. SB368]